jgi:hypothetical protein
MAVGAAAITSFVPMSQIISMRFGARLFLGLFFVTQATEEEAPQAHKNADVLYLCLFWFRCDIDRGGCRRRHCRNKWSGGFWLFVAIANVINRNGGLCGNQVT